MPSEKPKTEAKGVKPEIEIIPIRGWEDLSRYIRSLREIHAGDWIYDPSAFIEGVNKARMSIFADSLNFCMYTSFLRSVSRSIENVFSALASDQIAERGREKYTESGSNRVRIRRTLTLVRTKPHDPKSDPSAPKETKNG